MSLPQQQEEPSNGSVASNEYSRRDSTRTDSRKASVVDVPPIPNPNGAVPVWDSRPGTHASARTPRTAKRDPHSVDADFLIEHITAFISETRILRDLGLFIVFLVMFIFFFLYGRNLTQNHYANEAIRNAFIDKTHPSIATETALLIQEIALNASINIPSDTDWSDVQTDGDWYDWFDQVVSQLWDCGANINTTDSNLLVVPFTFAGQLYPLGALRVRMQRVTNTSCAVNTAFYSSDVVHHPRTCYGEYGAATQYTMPCNVPDPINPTSPLYQYRSSSDVSGTVTQGDLALYDAGGFVVEIPFDLSCSTAQAYADLFRGTTSSCPLIDVASTRFVMTEFFMYAPNLDMYHSMKMYIEISGGGGMIPSYELRDFTVWTPKLVGQTVFDFFYLVVVLISTLKLVSDWNVDYTDTLSRFHFLTNVFNILDVVNIACMLTVFALRWTWWSLSRSATLSLPFTSYPGDLDTLLWLYSQQVYVNAVNTVITFLKTLKYLQLNPRLGVLGNTLAHAKDGMFGLVTLYVLVVTAYALTGYSLFGYCMESFHTLSDSYSSLIKMLVGQFDYDTMEQTAPDLAGLFFWTYIVLSNFLILNFIVAVVCEGFKMMNEVAATSPLGEEIERAVRSWFRMISPGNIRRVATLWRSGSSDLYLAKLILTYLVEHRMTVLHQNSDPLSVTPADFRSFLPPELYERAEGFVAVYWPDFLEAYRLSEDGDEKEEARDFQSSIADGLDLTVCHAADGLIHFSKGVRRLDPLLSEVISKLKNRDSSKQQGET